MADFSDLTLSPSDFIPPDSLPLDGVSGFSLTVSNEGSKAVVEDFHFILELVPSANISQKYVFTYLWEASNPDWSIPASGSTSGNFDLTFARHYSSQPTVGGPITPSSGAYLSHIEVNIDYLGIRTLPETDFFNNRVSGDAVVFTEEEGRKFPTIDPCLMDPEPFIPIHNPEDPCVSAFAGSGNVPPPFTTPLPGGGTWNCFNVLMNDWPPGFGDGNWSYDDSFDELCSPNPVILPPPIVPPPPPAIVPVSVITPRPPPIIIPPYPPPPITPRPPPIIIPPIAPIAITPPPIVPPPIIVTVIPVAITPRPPISITPREFVCWCTVKRGTMCLKTVCVHPRNNPGGASLWGCRARCGDRGQKCAKECKPSVPIIVPVAPVSITLPSSPPGVVIVPVVIVPPTPPVAITPGYITQPPAVPVISVVVPVSVTPPPVTVTPGGEAVTTPGAGEVPPPVPPPPPILIVGTPPASVTPVSPWVSPTPPPPVTVTPGGIAVTPPGISPIINEGPGTGVTPPSVPPWVPPSPPPPVTVTPGGVAITPPGVTPFVPPPPPPPPVTVIVTPPAAVTPGAGEVPPPPTPPPPVTITPGGEGAFTPTSPWIPPTPPPPVTVTPGGVAITPIGISPIINEGPGVGVTPPSVPPWVSPTPPPPVTVTPGGIAVTPEGLTPFVLPPPPPPPITVTPGGIAVTPPGISPIINEGPGVGVTPPSVPPWVPPSPPPPVSVTPSPPGLPITVIAVVPPPPPPLISVTPIPVGVTPPGVTPFVPPVPPPPPPPITVTPGGVAITPISPIIGVPPGVNEGLPIGVTPPSVPPWVPPPPPPPPAVTPGGIAVTPEGLTPFVLPPPPPPPAITPGGIAVAVTPEGLAPFVLPPPPPPPAIISAPEGSYTGGSPWVSPPPPPPPPPPPVTVAPEGIVPAITPVVVVVPPSLPPFLFKEGERVPVISPPPPPPIGVTVAPSIIGNPLPPESITPRHSNLSYGGGRGFGTSKERATQTVSCRYFTCDPCNGCHEVIENLTKEQCYLKHQHAYKTKHECLEDCLSYERCGKCEGWRCFKVKGNKVCHYGSWQGSVCSRVKLYPSFTDCMTECKTEQGYGGAEAWNQSKLAANPSRTRQDLIFSIPTERIEHRTRAGKVDDLSYETEGRRLLQRNNSTQNVSRKSTTNTSISYERTSQQNLSGDKRTSEQRGLVNRYRAVCTGKGFGYCSSSRFYEQDKILPGWHETFQKCELSIKKFCKGK